MIRLEREYRQAEARAAHDAAIRAQPLQALTLGDLEGRELPTLREAAAIVLEYGALEAGADGTLTVLVPENLRRERRYLDAAIVLGAAAPTVLEARAAKDDAPLAERLPDVHVLACGGLAA